VFNKKYAAVTRGPGWGGRAVSASRAPRKVLSVIARSAATRQSEQNPAVISSTRSGRSLPRRTNPRHFHECGTKIQVPPHTKTHRHSELLPVILWSLLPFVILRKGSALTKNLFPRKIDS